MFVSPREITNYPNGFIHVKWKMKWKVFEILSNFKLGKELANLDSKIQVRNYLTIIF